MTFEEYKEFYEKRGYLPNSVSVPKGRLNEKQLKRKFEKFLEQTEKKGYTNSIDEKWETLKSQMTLSQCLLVQRLEEGGHHEAVRELKERAGFLFYTIDPAHVFPKGGYPYLKYDEDNVAPLNRYSHGCLDTMRDPISGEPITKEVHEKFWKMIVGDERYTVLKEKIRIYEQTRFGN